MHACRDARTGGRQGRGPFSRCVAGPGPAVLTLLLGIACTEPPPPRPELDAVSAYMRELERWGLSGQLLIARGDEVLLDESYGVANPLTGAPVTGETVFDIASLSKQFTAAAILALREEGRLDVRDGIGVHLASVPPDKTAITIHQLLTHTSGLVDAEDPPLPVPGDRDAAVLHALSLPLESEPGEAYAYSNIGYTLLAAIVETASDTTFEGYLRARLFDRAGMSSTGFAWERGRWDDRNIAAGIGGYEGRFRSGDPRRRPESWLRRGPGGVLSNVGDLFAWERALRGGDALSDESLALLFEPHTAAEAEFLSYAYGWRVQRTPRETTLVWHTGWDEAFSAVYRRYVEEGLTVLFLSNTSRDLTPVRELVLRSAREGEIGERLFEGKATHRLPPTVSAPRLREGEYRLENGGSIAVRGGDGALLLSPRDQEGAEALIPGVVAERAALDAAEAEALALVRAFASDPAGIDPEVASRIDPYGFAGVGVAKLAAELDTLGRELGGIRSFSALGTLPVGLPGRTRPVTTVRIEGPRGTADYRVIRFAEDEIYVLNGPSTALERRFVTLEDGRSLSVGLLTADTTFVSVEGDTLSIRLQGSAKPARAIPR